MAEPNAFSRQRVLPWWANVLLIFAGSRVVTTVIMLTFAGMQAANPWTAAQPDYFSFAGIWDGNWYHIVATSGYPSALPHTSDGHVDQNAWAFLPLYPWLTGAIAVIPGLGFNAAGVIVSVAFAAGAALMFYRLLEPRLGSSTALFSVVLFCVAPLSPVYQVVYAESMQLFFLMVALYFLQQRRYWVMLPFVAIMAFTRPTGLAFALAMGLYVVYRWVRHRSDPFPLREQLSAIAATLISAALGYAWPFIAGLVTGVPDAYTATELSWRAPYVGWVDLVPFQPWIQGAEWWMGRIGVQGYTTPIVLLVIAVLLWFGFLFTPWARRLGPELRLWTASWTIYLLAVFFPQSSVFRLFAPAFPVLGALAQPKNLVYRVILVLLMIAGQVAWVYMVWWFSDSDDWTPP